MLKYSSSDKPMTQIMGNYFCGFVKCVGLTPSEATNTDETLLQVAVHNGRSGWVRRHVKKDQEKKLIKPLKLKKNIEVR